MTDVESGMAKEDVVAKYEVSMRKVYETISKKNEILRESEFH